MGGDARTTTDAPKGDLRLDVQTLNLDAIADLPGTALASILTEVRNEPDQLHARHSSHSSYTTHGTGAW
jgi:hypothetical protein